MKDTYHTIRVTAEGLYREKGSKFIAFAWEVDSEEAIRERLTDLKKKYHDARHHCYAWRLGADMKHYRSNGDGEPAGSAGNPILGQIRSHQLTDVLVVVVRYFGGTLLGVGGLIQAYRAAAADALEKAGRISKKVYSRWELRFGYDQMNPVMKLVKDLDLVIEDQQYDLECSMVLSVWKRDEGRVRQRVSLFENCRITQLE